ncbi:MAG: MarC family protein [Gammaproteobacteria bacterium]|nr:MarC family protein [Pseudomonadales bacterium]MCP5349076.1 MarC family protein [Pseudomonadales bacterium]
MDYITEYTRFFTALLVILDPFAVIPILLGLTAGYQAKELNKAVNLAALTVFIVLALAAAFGENILTVLGASLPSFRVGGGIILLLMGLALLRAEPDQMRTTPLETEAAQSYESIAVVPIAIPLLAGPGSISTVIIQMQRPGAENHLLWVILVTFLVCVIVWAVLRLAGPIGRFLGPIGLNVMNRLFGLILTALAVEIMANGLRGLFPALSG